MLGYYVFYDFGSEIGIYIEDHENGWTFYAILQAIWALSAFGFYIFIFVAEYALDMHPFDRWVFIFSFYIFNT